jgi:hypothetical protein
MGLAVRDLALGRDLDRDFDRARPLRATKAREVAFGLELPADRGCEAPVAAPELLRDRGGEDARVAMLGGYAIARIAQRVTRRLPRRFRSQVRHAHAGLARRAKAGRSCHR